MCVVNLNELNMFRLYIKAMESLDFNLLALQLHKYHENLGQLNFNFQYHDQCNVFRDSLSISRQINFQNYIFTINAQLWDKHRGFCLHTANDTYTKYYFIIQPGSAASAYQSIPVRVNHNHGKFTRYHSEYAYGPQNVPHDLSRFGEEVMALLSNIHNKVVHDRFSLEDNDMMMN